MERTLVFGASVSPDRYSNMAIHRLKRAGKEVVAFGLKKGTVTGVEIDTELKPYEDIDTITLYMNPLRQKAYYEYLIGLHPRRIIFNPGTENPEFYRLLEARDIEAEVACTLVLLATDEY